MKQRIPLITPRLIDGCSVSKFDYVPEQADLSSYMQSFYKQLHECIENKRLEQIRKRLQNMGYRFESILVLKEFLSKNATVVTYPHKPDYREMCIFAGTNEQVTFGAWWETYEYVHNFENPERGFTMTIIAGKPPQC